jgi:cell division protein FtsB
MKFYAAALAIVFLALQYRLWLGDDGVRSAARLSRIVSEQTTENRGLMQRNQQLKAEVKDLKEGLAALEERARNDLGMIGPGENFYQVVDAGSAGPPTTLPAAPSQAPGIKRISR